MDMAEKIEILVEGGKASPAPPLGPKLGELKMNVGQVITEINKKTADFKGMKVPVIIEIQKDKSYTITVGTPPTSQLIKKEVGIELGSGEPNNIKVANASIEQIIKVAKMKQGNMFTKDLKSAVKTVVGSLVSMGVIVEGKEPKEMIKDIDSGKYDKEIKEGKTEMSQEKAAEFKAMTKDLQEKAKKELERRKEAAAAAVAAPAAGAPEGEKKEVKGE